MKMKSKSVLLGLLFSLVLLLPLTSKDANAVISLSVNPASLPADSLTGFTFQTQANTASGGVQFEVYFDFNGNGIIDGDEWPFFNEVFVDNMATGDEMLSGDNDPASPNITVDLIFDGGIFIDGSFVAKVENEIGENATVQFTITAISSPQTVTGTIYEQGTTTPVVNALVYSGDVTTDSFISATTTNVNGSYTLQIPNPGDIYIGYFKEDYIGLEEGPPLTVPSGGISDFNLNLIRADAQIIGIVTEYGTGNPVWGVEIDADTTDGKESTTTTDISGNFTLPVLANKEWGIWIEDNLPPGYFGAAIPANNYQDNISLIPTVLGPNVIDAVVHKETAWIESTVMDEYGTQVVEGASLYASRINTTDPELQNLRNGKQNITGSLGQATVGVEAGDWSVGSCIGCEGFPVLVGGEQREIIRPSEQDVLNLLTGEHRQVILYAYYADCAVEGTVFHEDGVTPAVDVAIDSWTNNALNGPGQESVGAIYGNWGARSDATGHYRLPIMGGIWSVRASGSNMQSIWKQATCSPDGNDIVDQPGETIAGVDFILKPVPEFIRVVDTGLLSDAEHYGLSHYNNKLYLTGYADNLLTSISLSSNSIVPGYPAVLSSVSLPHGLVVDSADGTIWVCDLNNSTLRHYDTSLNLIESLPVGSQPVNAIIHQNTIYVADRGLEKIFMINKSTLTIEDSFAVTGMTSYSYIDLFIYANKLYVVGDGISGIIRMDLDGTNQEMIMVEGETFLSANGIYILNDQIYLNKGWELIVTDLFGNRIQEFWFYGDRPVGYTGGYIDIEIVSNKIYIPSYIQGQGDTQGSHILVYQIVSNTPHHEYDTNQNCIIGNFELLDAIDVWAAGGLGNFELLDVIDMWATGPYC